MREWRSPFFRLAPAFSTAIAANRNVMGGRACIRGLRITVSLLVNLVANGMAVREILDEYPDLEAEDIQQALAYVAALANDEFHPFTPTAA